MNGFFKNFWGGTKHFLEQGQPFRLGDLLAVGFLAGIIYGITGVAREWAGVMRPTVEIDLSPLSLPKYTFFSLSRGMLAYILSLAFTLVYGMWAAKDRLAERVLIPLLDILQSIPVLGFMPGLILAMVALFPKSNTGVELSAVVMIFTGQAWNMTFSFYHSLRSIPRELEEVSHVYRFSSWERFRWVELPSSTMGLVWNSMMSMAGGWFFLMICEAFILGDKDFRLPGLGSYMSVAVAKGDSRAMAWAILAMIIMIVALDQFFWRPVVVWAQKFRVEEGGQSEEMTSWFLDVLRKSKILAFVEDHISSLLMRTARSHAPSRDTISGKRLIAPLLRILPPAAFAVLALLLFWGAWRLLLLVIQVHPEEWLTIVSAAGLTLARVTAAIIVGTFWALPCGLAIGLSPRLSRSLQPVVQVMASFPAPMLFPMAIAVMLMAGIGIGWGSIVLMLLGTQWYILFNVIAGAMAIPADLREAATSYRIKGWRRFRLLNFPAVLPYLITGWVTAAGGAWNASIVSEYVTYHNKTLTAFGLGSQISIAAEKANFPLLAASILVMSMVVVVINRTVWQRLYLLAQERFSINR